ncbi:hypothetical protein ABPG74_001640 [Tetrahymena malaccensis]
MSFPKKVVNKERQICEAPELTVYEHTTEMQTSHMCQEEIEINNWLEENNIQMADPLDLIHQYFHVKKKKISEKIAENKKSKGLTQGSLLLERRAKKNVNAPTISFSENI